MKLKIFVKPNEQSGTSSLLVFLKGAQASKLEGLRLCHGEKTKVSTIRPKDEVQPFYINLIENEEEKTSQTL